MNIRCKEISRHHRWYDDAVWLGDGDFVHF